MPLLSFLPALGVQSTVRDQSIIICEDPLRYSLPVRVYLSALTKIAIVHGQGLLLRRVCGPGSLWGNISSSGFTVGCTFDTLFGVLDLCTGGRTVDEKYLCPVGVTNGLACITRPRTGAIYLEGVICLEGVTCLTGLSIRGSGGFFLAKCEGFMASSSDPWSDA